MKREKTPQEWFEIIMFWFVFILLGVFGFFTDGMDATTIYRIGFGLFVFVVAILYLGGHVIDRYFKPDK